MLSARPFQKAVVRRSGRNPHIIIFHRIVPAHSPRPRRQELRYRQRCLPEKMARDESAIRLRGTGFHWAEAPRRRMKSRAETLSDLYPVCPPKLYANVQLLQSKFCVQRVDERERRFAVSSGCLSRAERTGRGALLSPSRGLSSYSRKIFHRKVFRVCGGREFLGNLFSYKRFPEANLRSNLASPFPRRLNDTGFSLAAASDQGFTLDLTAF